MVTKRKNENVPVMREPLHDQEIEALRRLNIYTEKTRTIGDAIKTLHEKGGFRLEFSYDHGKVTDNITITLRRHGMCKTVTTEGTAEMMYRAAIRECAEEDGWRPY